ncbi:MAG: SDR family oxidoreductase, partial [Dehalococcoidia bacterium]|nr:SDR family oxidoreductase [Dehalococcoidia bacterium]
SGAALGLGSAYARAVACVGADVAVCDVKPEVSAVADEIAATSGQTVRAYPCDVSDTEAVRGFVDAVLRDFGGVDVVVMNAGIYGSTPMDLPREEALSEYQRFMDTNVKSIYVLERAFAPSLVEREGDIVVISTDHILPPLEPGGTRGGPSTDLYDASKWVLNGYIQAWALGFAANGQNVRVNGIAMGATDTPMLRGVFPGGSPPDDVVAGWMTPAQQGQLMLDLLQDGRTGDLISSEPGHPVELPPRSGMGQPVSNLPAEQFHHGLMGLEPAIWEPPS